MPPELSLVIPLHNEAANLSILAAEIRAALDGRSYEVLWVDDGSTDGGAQVLAALALADGRLRVVSLPARGGQSAALLAGFAAARGDVIVTLDADLQSDPADIPHLLAELPGADLVCGIRRPRHDAWTRRASSWIANAVRNWATGERITDVGCSLRAGRAEFLRRLPRFDGMHRFLPTFVRLDGGRIRETAVHHRPRLHGRSKYGVGNRLLRTAADLLAVRWLARRWVPRQPSER